MFSMQIKMSWNIYRLTLRVLKDRDTCLEWCREQELLPREKNCHKCNRKMTFDPDRGLGRFRCRYDHRGRGTIEISATKETWFENVKTSPSKIRRMLFNQKINFIFKFFLKLSITPLYVSIPLKVIF